LYQFVNFTNSYADVHQKDQAHKELLYVYDTIKLYYEKKILTPQRVHVVFNMMEKNYEYYSQNNTKNKVTLIYYRDSNFPWAYFPDMGIQFDPVVCMNHLNEIYRMGLTDDFIRGLSELISYRNDVQLDNRQCTVWEYNFENPKLDDSNAINYPHTWISGMSQGLMLELLTNYINTTKSSTYNSLANSIMMSMLVNWTKGGTTDFDMKHDEYWYLEYPFTNRCRVLNGFMVTLIGLYQYYNITANKTALFLFSKGMNALRVHLPEYDVGNWSAYSLTNRRATLYYHKFHIQLLDQLYIYTNDHIVKYYADLFKKYLNG